ncbi:hypothetical protein HBH56_036010 [Parastagonospora nodorum]|uniref:Uncharacterized protein n=1 Tax=Phaeosphaeria nodorum (strain SN15 / ATCC MYA-4574 / FGSC 10173) TaxID=321614 RepID=A0A7U2F7A3_PHANO|nr:hypothetical protein HBH56_036010 [Parastagonospora nodorum]QRD00061.1 hypothetical protein JI435_437840 [Parastagonospora nodorum SN15]KAH3933718.1 hypothetical protein HBH54_063460 [Parastagonospora nodorum]KAH4108460.1 hypothetical protein HBH46_043460 [Parastagonospora nodorum]KAH4143057.1 hypothetical protein HBH45_044430 [Parastagonospora nodorum]
MACQWGAELGLESARWQGWHILDRLTQALGWISWKVLRSRRVFVAASLTGQAHSTHSSPLRPLEPSVMGDKRLQPWDMAEATFGSGQGDLRRLAAGSWIACRDRCGESFMARMIVLHMASNVP